MSVRDLAFLVRAAEHGHDVPRITGVGQCPQQGDSADEAELVENMHCQYARPVEKGHADD